MVNNDPPVRPQLAVSASIFRDGKVLLVRRAHAPGKGAYSLPGGRVEFGETLHTALHREIDEETKLTVEIAGLAAWREAMPANSGGGHYVILSFAARWMSGEPLLNDEHEDFKWIAPDALDDFLRDGVRVTDGLPQVIEAAWRVIRS